MVNDQIMDMVNQIFSSEYLATLVFNLYPTINSAHNNNWKVVQFVEINIMRGKLCTEDVCEHEKVCEICIS